MRKFVLALNNKIGYECARVILNKGYCPDAVILHPRNKGNYVDEILSILPNHVKIWFWSHPGSNAFYEELSGVKCEVLLSVNFGYLFSGEFLSKFAFPLNLHTSLLPYNRGANPNVWSIYEGTPAGVTLHRMTESIDDGEIYSQIDVPVDQCDTGKSLYEKLGNACKILIDGEMENILLGKLKPLVSMDNSLGTYHSREDFRNMLEIDTKKTVVVGDFIKKLRAFTFPPYKNLYFQENGRRYYVEVVISEEPKE